MTYICPLIFLNYAMRMKMQNFINSHPGCENDEELESLADKVGPPQTTDPKLFGNVDMAGIPDQLRPGKQHQKH
jgi:hypothetical protein